VDLYVLIRRMSCFRGYGLLSYWFLYLVSYVITVVWIRFDAVQSDSSSPLFRRYLLLHDVRRRVFLPAECVTRFISTLLGKKGTIHNISVLKDKQNCGSVLHMTNALKIG
jgi:hypothetical protein